MSRIKSPDEKKRMSLARDHRTFALEGNKTFRSAWPLKKVKANRRFRKASKAALANTADPDQMAEHSTPKRIRSLQKYGVMTLAQSIDAKADNSGLRWHLGILRRNPAALEAAFLLKRTRTDS